MGVIDHSAPFLTYPQVREVSALADLSALQTLYLDGTAVTEASLESLAAHPTLSGLGLAGIPVTSGNHALQIISGDLLLNSMSPGPGVLSTSAVWH